MKTFILSIVILAWCSLGIAQQFNLGFDVVTNNGTTFEVDIVMSFTSMGKLGTSNLEFSFNDAALSNPTFVSDNLSGNYNTSTVTMPLPGVASFNIELGTVNTGDAIAVSLAETVIGRISFTTTDPLGNADLQWRYNGMSTQTVVFLDDESTQIFANNLMGLNTAPLPVELVYFKAQPTAQQTVDLWWGTASETNNSHFEIDRSANGKSFTYLGRVPGAGTTVESRDYRFEDTKPLSGTNYYRLKQVDLDGTFTYSQTRAVNFTADKKEQVQLYPNPADELLTVALDTYHPFTTLQIFDAQGRLMFSLPVVDATMQVNVADLPGGVYNIRFQQKNGRAVAKPFVRE